MDTSGPASVVGLTVLVLQVKVLFVRNLANGVTEEILEKSFSQFGKLERVKKLKDYAFIHFEERDGAMKVPRSHRVPHTCLTAHEPTHVVAVPLGAGGNEREGAGGRTHRDCVREAPRPEEEGTQSPETSRQNADVRSVQPVCVGLPLFDSTSVSSGTTTIITTHPRRTWHPQSEGGAGEAAGAATHTPRTTMATRTTTITTATTITTTAAATTTRTTATTTSRLPREGGAAAEGPGVEPRQAEVAAAPGHPEAGPTSPSGADRDQAAEDGAQEEACSREGEEGYVVLGVAAVEM